MKSLNEVNLIGNVTRNPEMRHFQGNLNMCVLGLVTNRSHKGQDGNWHDIADFHNVTFWGKLAEIVFNYAKKGKKVFVRGRLEQREWTDKDSQKKRYSLKIIGQDLILLSSKSSNQDEQLAPPDDGSQADAPLIPEDLPF